MDKLRKLLLPTWRPMMHVMRPYCYANQVQALASFPTVKIAEGKGKYVMAHVYIHGEMANAKEVIRSSKSAKYHLDIYDCLQKEAHALDLCTQGLGGGFLVQDSEKKYIKIYGRSEVLGKADHEKARDVLKSKFADFKIDAESGGMEP